MSESLWSGVKAASIRVASEKITAPTPTTNTTKPNLEEVRVFEAQRRPSVHDDRNTLKGWVATVVAAVHK